MSGVIDLNDLKKRPEQVKAAKVKVAAPHEFRAQDNVVNHYEMGQRKMTLLVDIPNTKEGKLLARQIARALNDAFKFGIRFGFNYKATEGLSEEQIGMLFDDEDITLGKK